MLPKLQHFRLDGMAIPDLAGKSSGYTIFVNGQAMCTKKTAAQVISFCNRMGDNMLSIHFDDQILTFEDFEREERPDNKSRASNVLPLAREQTNHF
jgi:hypothetical protein